MSSEASIFGLARAFCKTYSEFQEVRLGACYTAPHAIAAAGPTAPTDLAWWLASYNNTLNASAIGASVVAGDEEAVARYGSVIDAMSFATCLVPEIATGNIQSAFASGELFIQWCRQATAVVPLFQMTEASLADSSIVLESKDVTDVMATIMRLINTHCFQHASHLFGILLAFIRKDAVIDAGCEKSVSEVQSLLLNDFNSPVMFHSWQKKAQDYLKDARVQLQPQGYDAATVKALKGDLLKILVAFSGDVETAGVLVGNVPSLHLAGVCSYIEPFMTYERLGQRALTIYSATGNPAAKASAGIKSMLTDPSVAVIGSLLACRTLADVASAMDAYSLQLYKNQQKQHQGTLHSNRVANLVGLMVAAHVADAASPPFASPTSSGMKAVVSANSAFERFVSDLEDSLDASEIYTDVAPIARRFDILRLCAHYLCWRPLANPTTIKDILFRAVERAEDVLLSSEDLEDIANNLDECEGDDAEKGNKENESALTESTALYAHHQIDSYVATLDGITDMIYSLFHMNSPLQMRLRPILVDLNPSAATPLLKWWDTYTAALIANSLRPKIATILVKAERYTELLIRAIATSRYDEIKRVLEKALRGRDALTHPAVLQCGEAINFGIVDLATIVSALSSHNALSAASAVAAGNLSSSSMNASISGAGQLLLGSAATATPMSALATSNVVSTNPQSVDGAAAAETIALLHMCSCIWGMTVGALTSGNAFGELLAAARREKPKGHESDGEEDYATVTATVASSTSAAPVVLIERPFVDAAASLVHNALRLAGSYHQQGFERLAHSVRFTLLQRMTNVLEALRLNPSAHEMSATAASVFGADGHGVAKAQRLYAHLVDLATGIDTSLFAEEGVGGGEEATEELKALTRTLVEMGRCWCC